MKRCQHIVLDVQHKVQVKEKLYTAGRWWLGKEGVYEDVKWMWEVFGSLEGSLGAHTWAWERFSPIIFIQQSHMFPSLYFIIIRSDTLLAQL